MLRVLDIVAGTAVDGPGLRTAIYFAGCTHRCPGCHNPESWDVNGGRNLEYADILKTIDENGFNVTFTGGDPLAQLPALIPLAKKIFERGFTIWLYTGFTFEEAIRLERFYELSPYIEVMVDGTFQERLRDTSLQFRGSTNQRLIEVKPTLETGEIKLWADQF